MVWAQAPLSYGLVQAYPFRGNLQISYPLFRYCQVPKTEKLTPRKKLEKTAEKRKRGVEFGCVWSQPQKNQILGNGCMFP